MALLIKRQSSEAPLINDATEYPEVPLVGYYNAAKNNSDLETTATYCYYPPPLGKRLNIGSVLETLRITEIFYSLQGESLLVGLPTVFIRLTGCPLRCNYCDTEYAFTGGERMTIEAICQQVASFECRQICVTGGEPLAQKGCLDLMAQLCDLDYQVSLETSGALAIENVDPRVILVMDLKTPNSGEMIRNRMENIQYLGSKDQLKFVICNRRDYDWAVMQLVEQQLQQRCSIIFSPSYNDQDATELAEWILRDKLPVRMQVQLHKILWGEKKGV